MSSSLHAAPEAKRRALEAARQPGRPVEGSVPRWLCGTSMARGSLGSSCAGAGGLGGLHLPPLARNDCQGAQAGMVRSSGAEVGLAFLSGLRAPPPFYLNAEEHILKKKCQRRQKAGGGGNLPPAEGAPGRPLLLPSQPGKRGRRWGGGVVPLQGAPRLPSPWLSSQTSTSAPGAPPPVLVAAVKTCPAPTAVPARLATRLAPRALSARVRGHAASLPPEEVPGGRGTSGLPPLDRLLRPHQLRCF